MNRFIDDHRYALCGCQWGCVQRFVVVKLVGKLVDVSTLLGNYRMVSRSDVCCFINHG